MWLQADWKRHLKNAWSVRLIILAAGLSAIEAIFPFIGEYLGLSPQQFALLTAAITFMALPARLMAQSYTHKDHCDEDKT